jgi:hypothetical protein
VVRLSRQRVRLSCAWQFQRRAMIVDRNSFSCFPCFADKPNSRSMLTIAHILVAGYLVKAASNLPCTTSSSNSPPWPGFSFPDQRAEHNRVTNYDHVPQPPLMCRGTSRWAKARSQPCHANKTDEPSGACTSQRERRPGQWVGTRVASPTLT